MATKLILYEYLCQRLAWKMLAVIADNSLTYNELSRKYLEFEDDYTGNVTQSEKWDIDSTLEEFAKASVISQKTILFTTRYSLVPEILVLNSPPYSYEHWRTVFNRGSAEEWEALPKYSDH